MSQTKIIDAIIRSRQTAAFYQADALKSRDTLKLLKGKLIQQHQAELFRSNEGRFVELRKQIYECFRDCAFPTWDPDIHPDGLYYKHALAILQIHPWGTNIGERTYSRRLNELADKRVTNPPLLAWTRPGYYVLANVEASQ